jgi:hypothetical protein
MLVRISPSLFITDRDWHSSCRSETSQIFADIRCLSATVARRLHGPVIIYVHISVTFYPIVFIQNSKYLENLRDNFGQISYFEYFKKLSAVPKKTKHKTS